MPDDRVSRAPRAPFHPFLLAGLACAALACAASPAFALLAKIGPGTPPGWSGPVVPRNTDDATNVSAPLPAQLSSTTPTYFNWAVSTNAAVNATWRDEFNLDEELIQLTTHTNHEFVAKSWLAINTGPTSVDGGRHSLSLQVDAGHTVGEDYGDTYNNYWEGHFLWQPVPLASGSALFTRPPQGQLDPGLPDCSAFEFTRSPGTAWVVSVGTTIPNQGFALVAYDDYVNSTTGLSHEIGRSPGTGGPTNFMVGSAAGAPATFYPAVMRPPDTPASYLPMAAADAYGRRIPTGAGSWPGVNLPANQSAHVFEAYLTAGIAESAHLTRFMGQSDLEVLAFPPDLPVMGRAQAMAISTPRDNDDEYDDLTFTPSSTGWYLFVVARVDGQHIDEASGYTFALEASGLVAAPNTFSDAPLAAAPTPASGPMRLSFALARSQRVRLEVFDLAGRAVRRLADEAFPAGPNARVWDGTDDRGAAVAPGRYWARLTAGSRVENLGVLRIR